MSNYEKDLTRYTPDFEKKLLSNMEIPASYTYTPAMRIDPKGEYVKYSDVVEVVIKLISDMA